MVRAGRALLVGAAIGRASARRHQDQQQPEVVVVTTAPTAYPPGGYPPPQTVVYGTAQPVYGAPVTTTTTVYSHSSSHAAPVVVAQSKAAADKKGKKKRMVCLFVCVFVAALVLCLTLVPWPGSRYIDLYPNEQTTVFANGLFILSTEVTTNAGDLPVEVRGYRDAPSLAWVSYGPLEETFVPAYTVRTNQVNTFVNYDTYAYITVPASPSQCVDNVFYVYAFAGENRYDDFVNNGNIGFARTWSFFANQGLPRVEYYINNRDVYYFVLYNPVCTNVVNTTTLSVDFRSYRYPVGSPQFICTTGNCIDEVPYGEFRYYVAEVPYTSDTAATYRSEILLIGNSGAYIGLYVGLFGTMILCGVVALVASKKKEREAEDAENGDRNPLLGQHQHHQAHVATVDPPRSVPPAYDAAVASTNQYQAYPAPYVATQAPYTTSQVSYTTTQAPYTVT